jgi:hypothetical protein
MAFPDDRTATALSRA